MSASSAAKPHKDPLRDRKAPFAHFSPIALTVSLGKVLIIRGYTHLEHKEGQAPAGNTNIAKLIASEIAPGFVRDVLTTTTARGIEHIVVAKVSIKTAGRLMRGQWRGVGAACSRLAARGVGVCVLGKTVPGTRWCRTLAQVLQALERLHMVDAYG